MVLFTNYKKFMLKTPAISIDGGDILENAAILKHHDPVPGNTGHARRIPRGRGHK